MEYYILDVKCTCKMYSVSLSLEYVLSQENAKYNLSCTCTEQSQSLACAFFNSFVHLHAYK